MSSSSERRKAEIEAKRAKLAELRKAREERKSMLIQQQKESEGSTSAATRREFDELVSSLVGSRGLSSRSSLAGGGTDTGPGTAGDATPSSAAGGTTDTGGPGTAETSDVAPSKVLVSKAVETEPTEAPQPQKEKVLYTKEVQTANTSLGDSDDERPTEGEIRARILKEQQAEKEKLDREIEEEKRRLQKEIEEDTSREMTDAERAAIYGAPDFSEFVEQSSKIVQRALTDTYDYMKDYKMDGEAGRDDSEGRRVKCVCTFWDEKTTKNRTITDIDWSLKHPELSVASYNRKRMSVNEPDGIVAVWNLHLLERPEFVFHSQTDVLSVSFSPFHNNLIIGGTYSGQILLWDTRAKHLPVLKSPLSAAGHTHPVYAMQMVGTQNAHNLITASTDGLMCSWMLDMLAKPQESLELVHPAHNKTDEVSVTCLSFPENETTTFWVGTEEGNVYQAHRYDRAGSKAGLNQLDIYRAHSGPVTGLHFHPLVGPVDFSDLFLTSSVDWTVKLWRAKNLNKPSTAPQVLGPVHNFEEAGDYVYDVRWHPQHPAVFGSVDGAGKFDLYNLNIETEVPILSTTVGTGRALNKLSWDKRDGRKAAMGGADGRLYIYDIGDVASPRDNEWVEMQRTLAGLLSQNAGAPSETPAAAR